MFTMYINKINWNKNVQRLIMESQIHFEEQIIYFQMLSFVFIIHEEKHREVKGMFQNKF